MSREHWPLGMDLKARRKAKGWSQRQLAKAAGIGRTAVQYWEGAFQIDPKGWAVCRMADALGWELPRPVFRTDTRRRGDGLLAFRAALEADVEGRLAAAQAREAERAARRRVVCGAKTRKGMPCRLKSEPGKRRCKFHGGKSTGARTPEGVERIREAQRRRWAKVRTEKQHDNSPAVNPDLSKTPDALA